MTTRTFSLDGPINLQVRIGRGSLTVDAVDDLAEARVDLTARSDSSAADRILVEMSGRTLVVEAPRQGGLADLLGGWTDAVDVAVTVPSGTAMRVASFSAPVTVHGRAGGIDVATGSGDIELDVVDGDLRLRYGSAAAQVHEVRGSVQLRSGSGDAGFGTVTGDLSCGCGSGSLEVDSVGGRVRWRAGSGTARLGCVHDDVDVKSGSGRVSIGVPPGLSARLDVTAGSGRVSSQFPIESQQSGGGRAITVRARTGSGDIHLFRAA